MKKKGEQEKEKNLLTKHQSKLNSLFKHISQNKDKIFEDWSENYSFGELDPFVADILGDDQDQFIQALKSVYEIKSKIQQFFQTDNKDLQEDDFKALISKTKKQILELIKENLQQNIRDSQLPSEIKITKSQEKAFKKYQKEKQKQGVFKNIKDFNEFQNVQGFKKKQSKIRQYQYEKQKSKSKSKIVEGKKKSQEENQIQEQVVEIEYQKINGEQLQVQIKFLVQKVDPKYQWEQYSLLQTLKMYIIQALNQNPILVHKPTKELVILEDTIYQKSKDAGNYFFDPFCQVVQMRIKRKDGKLFQRSFQVKGQVKIIQTDVIDSKDWRKSLFIDPAQDIRKLVKLMCERKQQNKQMVQRVTNAFRHVGGVNKIKDLYEWTKEDYSKLQLKTTWVYEIQQHVQKIRDSSGQTISTKRGVDKLKKEKDQCIRISNAHKILRYVVYKTLGPEILDLISYLNYDNMLDAIKIVRQEIINEELLNDLQTYFFQFAATPKANDKVRDFSRGMVLFGPPGTGKTVVTEALPNIIGFHLIQKGLSAADFMKSLVGQSSRMIKDLVNRAKLSPHLLCSLGIDEVDGLVPDRKDKQQKNKGQGISMLLSVIGGNKDVPNLVFMTSTNHLKKIDQAIRRRLSGQFQVGRLTPEARNIIILQNLDYFKIESNKQMLEYLILITSNFTGAALKRLTTDIANLIRRKQMQKKSTILNKRQITETATKIAKQFSITLGVFTLPQIYSNKENTKYLFSEQFMSRISNQFVFLTSKDKKQFTLYYANQSQSYENGTLVSNYQVQNQTLNIGDLYDNKKTQLQLLESWVDQINKTSGNRIQIEKHQKKNMSDVQYLRIIKTKFKSRDRTTIFIIEDLNSSPGEIIFSAGLFQKPKENVYVFFFTQKIQSMQLLPWIKRQNRPYSGKIFVQLTDEAKMAFQLNTPAEDETKLHFKHFLKSQKTNASNDVIPQLVEFFTTRNVSYILLIDYQLLLQNGAYNDQKMFQIIQQKMGQALNYQNVAVIINVDSLIVLTQNASDSSMGRSQSYSIADNNMYRLLLHYMKEFNTVDSMDVKNNRKQKWMGIIAKHKQLIKILKKDLTWPLTPKERDQKKKEKELDQENQCERCGVYYTERQNQEERKCMQHPGYIIDIRAKSLQTVLTANEAKVLQLKYKNASKDKNNSNDNLYVFACCLKSLNDQGEKAYRHKSKKQSYDQVEEQRKNRIQQWQKLCTKL